MSRVMRMSGMLVLAALVAAIAEPVSFESASDGTAPTITGLLSKPEGKGPFAAIVLLHTCGGPRRHVIETWPAYLTGLGYVTLMVDSFGPRGIVRCPPRPSSDELRDDAYGGLDFLAGLDDVDPRRIGAMGFSLGAITINDFAGAGYRSPNGHDFRATISLYGHCFGLRPSATTFPMAIIMGDRERSLHLCQAVEHPRVTLHVLPGAYHAFDVKRFRNLRLDVRGNKMMYSAWATVAAERIVKSFFAEHLER